MRRVHVMILKSKSRKKPTFHQLYDYMERGTEDPIFVLTHNLKLSRGTGREQVLEQFNENARFLRKSEKQNYLYHEIISLKITKELEKSRLQRIMYEIGKIYLQERAKENLAYGRIHIEKSQENDFTNAHLHLMISSNGFESTKRHRLEKTQFHAIQRNLERYICERYPELEQERVYDKHFEKIRVNEQEYQLKQRTGIKTQREKVKELLQFILEQSQTKEEFIEYCQKFTIAVYQRGKNTGVEIDGTKYRLNKLELEETYQKFCEKVQRIEELNKIHEQEIQKERVYESELLKTRMEELEKIRNEQERLRQKEQELEEEVKEIQRETDPQDIVSKRLQELYRLREQQRQYEQEQTREP